MLIITGSAVDFSHDERTRAASFTQRVSAPLLKRSQPKGAATLKNCPRSTAQSTVSYVCQGRCLAAPLGLIDEAEREFAFRLLEYVQAATEDESTCRNLYYVLRLFQEVVHRIVNQN